MLTNKKARQSNMECARIMAMSIIVIWHFFIHGGVFKNYHETRYLIPVFTWGVDLFIMISGYFLIKFRAESLIRLCTMIIGFSIFWTIISPFFPGGETISLKKIIIILIIPITSSDYWFIKVYLGLMVISPFLNAGLRKTPLKELRKMLIGLTLIEIYSCWYWGNSHLNPNGYSLFNFIYIYILGYYLREERLLDKLVTKQIVIIAVFCLLTNVVVNIATISIDNSLHNADYYSLALGLGGRYSNPFTIIFCACIILALSRNTFYSSVVNSFAGASLGVYLLQEGCPNSFIYEYQDCMLTQQGIGQYTIACLILFVAFWVLSWILTQVCNYASHIILKAAHCMTTKSLEYF